MDRLKNRPLLAALAAAAVTALGVGGVAIAQGGGNSPAPQATQEQSAPENSTADRDNVQDENGKDDATEKGEKGEKADGAEKGEKGGSEKPNDDGAGGHADEPGNPNADNQGGSNEK
jgi:hypothetical protein